MSQRNNMRPIPRGSGISATFFPIPRGTNSTFFSIILPSFTMPSFGDVSYVTDNTRQARGSGTIGVAAPHGFTGQPIGTTLH